MAHGKIEKRGQRRRKIKPVILIVTEGSQTEPNTVLPRVRPAHQRAHRIQFVFGNCSLLYLAAVSHPASRL